MIATAIWNTETGRRRGLTREQCIARAAKLLAKAHPDSLYLNVARTELVDRVEQIVFFGKDRP